jgi:hypothetical protein
VAAKTTKKRASGRRPPAPVGHGTPERPLYRRHGFLWLVAAGVAALLVVGVVLVATKHGAGASTGLPDTPDYHSRGLLLSRDGGRSWRLVLRAQLMGLALNPADPERVLAAGPGVLLSTDGGRHWRQPLKIEQGAGPVAWAPSNPKVAYTVGFDRTFYRSSDGGETWSAVG